LDAVGQGEAAALTRKAIDLAKQGDTTALRLCIERILPARKDRPVSFNMPRIETVADSVKTAAAIATAVADGELTPMEAAELSKVVHGYAHAIETAELAARLDRLEQAQVWRP
jgi:biotin synthase-like enzyme